MPISTSGDVLVNTAYNIFLDTQNESIVVDEFGTIDTLGEVITKVVEPGTGIVPGAITYTLQDFSYKVSLDTVLAADFEFTAPGEVKVSVATSDLFKLAFGDAIVQADIVGDVTEYTLTLNTGPTLLLEKRLRDFLLAKLGSSPTDDITEVEGFEAIIELANSCV